MTSLKINLWVVRTDKKCGHGSLASAPCQDHVNWRGSGRTLAYRRLLRAPRAATQPCRAAEQRYEVAPPHSMTSLASASNVGGIVRLSALAVLRLSTNSNLLGSMTGRSAGLSPLTIRPA